MPLLVGSIAANWAIARIFGRRPRPWLVPLGVAFNLALLGVFKYADFLADTAVFLAGFERERWNIVLPLAISFFTFQQISYLVDLGRGRAPVHGLRDYALYVSFFPQLIAGPIVRHHEIIPQFELDPRRDGLYQRLGRGLTLFAIGLAKKVIIADGLAGTTNAVFAEAVKGSAIAAADAWAGLLAFTFQLYFDFSGYSDMAIGLGLLFGFHLPLNFDAPYMATSIRDFWRRWHMTLMRFMRDYLYRPVGLALKGALREPAAVMATMIMVGLWHGAAWTFALFGAIHGAALVVNRLWRRRKLAMPRAAGWLLTFAFVALSLSLFRSESVPASLNLLAGAFGLHGLASTLVGVKTSGLVLIAVAAVISFIGPTSQTLVLERLRPAWPVSLAISCTFLFIVLKARMGAPPDFVYFQF